MDGQRKAGNELLAISHNANLERRRYMYPIDVDSFGRPIDAAWAASRDRNEHLVELKQIKGQSETHPLLLTMSSQTTVLSYLPGNPDGRFDHIVGSYARQALKDGIAMQDTKGYNPYKFSVWLAAPTRTTPRAVPPGELFGGHASLDGRSKPHVGLPVRRSGRATGESCGSYRRLGRREHPRLYLRRNAAQKRRSRQWSAHQSTLLRLGLATWATS